MFFLLFVLAAVEANCRNGYIISSGLTCSEKAEILQMHNQLRNKVASGAEMGLPKAQNMLQMRWNDEIANYAQILADTCVFEHNTEIGGVQVGQNLATIYFSGNVGKQNFIQQMVKSWIDERKHYKLGVFSSASGHYSQMIWGESFEVGCGLTKYMDGDTQTLILVCNYLPPGNYIGQPPYNYGKFNCGKHGQFRSRSYSNLCTPDGRYPEVC